MNYLSNLHLTSSITILIAIQYSVTIKIPSSYAGEQIFHLILQIGVFSEVSNKVLCPYIDLRVSSNKVAYEAD